MARPFRDVEWPMAPTSLLPSATSLPQTELGQAWLAQFGLDDRPAAERLLTSLSLVSHSAFERAVTNHIVIESEKLDGPVALFATREIDPSEDLFVQADHNGGESLDAVARGADLGSEARVVAIIRNLAKSRPDTFLNHPTIAKMRSERCRAIFVVDDFIGSGKRTSDFLTAIWRSPSVVSWRSLKWINFLSIAYSATSVGRARVARSATRPAIVVERDCPTFFEMPWTDEIKLSIEELCRIYGGRTSRRSMRLGFGRTMAAIVFEHGCPNNAPAILWAPASQRWTPLFPNRSVAIEQASAFPPDIVGRTVAEIQADLSSKTSPVAPPRIHPLGKNGVLALALLARGARSRASLAYATGLSAAACSTLIDRCTKRGYVTASLRLTPAGRAVLAEVFAKAPDANPVPQRGDDGYYPRQLRGLHGR